jgi:replicative DNA helicase
MADQNLEAQFLALFLREAEAGGEAALRIVGNMKPDVFEYEEIAKAYEYASGRFAKGDSLTDLEAEAKLTEILGDVWYHTIRGQSKQDGKIVELTRKVVFNYRARRQAEYLKRLAEKAEALVGTNDEQAAQLADSAISKLATFHSSLSDQGRPQTQTEVTTHLLNKIQNRGAASGIAMPYQKLHGITGGLLPGDLMAIAAYSGTGKSLLVANFWRQFVMANVPVIAFPTEMGLSWLARGIASHAKVPQMVAEREQWDRATQAEIESYELAVRELGQRPWEIVDRPSITPDEIIARASVLRRRWPGKPVVVMVDHMHRLNYGRQEADYAVGAATRALRNWARNDDQGGIILILLYQPRKPADDIMFYRPVEGYQIRGVSEVWNEIDFLLSPYRRWVMTSPTSTTPWGTPSIMYDKDHHPIWAAPKKDGAKVDDEHVYLKVGKQRTGGEGPTVMLNIEAPSGHIYELARPRLAVVGGQT